MMKKFARALQGALLLAALALMSVGFLPSQSDAQIIRPTCEEKGCYGGSYHCGIGTDPYTGELVQCKMPCT